MKFGAAPRGTSFCGSSKWAGGVGEGVGLDSGPPSLAVAHQAHLPRALHPGSRQPAGLERKIAYFDNTRELPVYDPFADSWFMRPTHNVSYSWTACFDRSAAATAEYAAAVYGEAGTAASAFDWDTVHVVFPWFLRSGNTSWLSIAQCIFRTEAAYKKWMMHAIWVNYRSTAATGHVPYEDYINRGGTRRPCRAATWGWVEVMHQPSLSNSKSYQVSWRDQLWSAWWLPEPRAQAIMAHQRSRPHA